MFLDAWFLDGWTGDNGGVAQTGGGFGISCCFSKFPPPTTSTSCNKQPPPLLPERHNRPNLQIPSMSHELQMIRKVRDVPRRLVPSPIHGTTHLAIHKSSSLGWERWWSAEIGPVSDFHNANWASALQFSLQFGYLLIVNFIGPQYNGHGMRNLSLQWERTPQSSHTGLQVMSD